MQDVKTLEHFCSKGTFFKELEARSEMSPYYKAGKFLCVRLDGIGLSKKYLKDNMSNDVFVNTIKNSVNETYKILKNRAPTDAHDQFLCVFAASDEVNFVYNSQPNYYDNRLYKAVTTTASVFSSVFTANGKKANRKGRCSNFFGAFDGRPLILDSVNDVCEYLTYRYSVYIRNTTVKLLRLESDITDLYELDNQNDFNYLTLNIEKYNLQETQSHIPMHSRIYMPTPSGVLEECKFDSIKSFASSIEEKIYAFEKWLNEKNS